MTEGANCLPFRGAIVKCLNIETLLSFCLSLVFSSLALAQDATPTDSNWRCNWTDCSPANNLPRDFPSTTKSFASETTNSEPLRDCDTTDKANCATECRGYFDKDYFRCSKECLAKICQQSKPEDPDNQMQAIACLEDESPACVTDCVKGVADNLQLRCRLDCLQRRCPNSPALTRSKEANSPGTIKCERCKLQNQRDCRDFCALSAGPLTPGLSAGMGFMACNKLCLQTACGSICL